MNPLVIIGLVLLGGVALYFIVAHPTKHPTDGGRPDTLEPRELRGPEQHEKRRQL